MVNETTEKDLLKLFQKYISITTRKYVDKEKEKEKETGTKKDYKSHLNRFPFDTINKILSVNENGWKVEMIQTNKKKKAEIKSGNESNFDEVGSILESPESVESADNKSATYIEFYNNALIDNTDESTYWFYCKYKDDKDSIFALPESKHTPKYLTLIIHYYKNGDLQYARTIANIVLRIAQKANSLIDKYEKREKLNRKDGETNTKWGNEVARFGKKLSALKKFVEFLYFDKNLEQNTTPYNKNDEEIKKLRNSIKRERIDKIDGAKELAKILGGELEFVKYAIEQSYFFAPTIVYDSMIKLALDLSSDDIPVPARKTTKEEKKNSSSYRHSELEINEVKGIYYSEGELDQNTGEYPFKKLVKQDKDGNDAVRTLIKKYTGYTVCEGQGSIFKNYVISHVWGRAFDPRYFTNFANIVLVPAWANGLMDKVANEEGSLESILQSTIMAICGMLYGQPKENVLTDIISNQIVLKEKMLNALNDEITYLEDEIEKKKNKNKKTTTKEEELKRKQKARKNLEDELKKLKKCEYITWDNICNAIPIVELKPLFDGLDVLRIKMKDSNGEIVNVPYRINILHNSGWDKLDIPCPNMESKVGYISKKEIIL